jgi:hypothetical protein
MESSEMGRLMKSFLIPMTTLAVLAAGALLAQNPNDQPQTEPDGQYEQGRAVARISVINGEVSVRRGDSAEVVAAALNAPLVANDSLLTSSSSRAEVQLDSGKILRIGPNSEVHFAGLDVKGFQIQIAAGTVLFRALRPSEAEAELDTPSVSVHPIREGAYRISVREDGTSEITVRSGAAEIYSPRGTEQLGPGRTMYARGQATDPEFQVAEAIPLDNWDRWNEDRDRYLERSRSYEHVARDIPGAEDLDQNGQWVNDPTYGSVWAPTVAPGWAPYRDGRWVWEDFYGWTWVSADPWGWAPYHYGRWFLGGAGWCWYPGPVFGRHYWAPAYVGFFGFGGRFGVGFGFGGLGWVPLAPFEVFHPWWGRGFHGGFRGGAFAGRTNIINNTNITNVYRNARVPGGVTGVNAANFGRGGSQFQTLNHAQIQQAGLVHGVVPVSPDRSSLRMSDRNVSGNFPQTRTQSFASRNQATGGNAGFQRAPNNNAGGGTSSGQGSHAWGRFGEPIHGSNGGGAAQSPAPAARSGNGWQRFDNTRPNGSAGQNGFAEGRGNSGAGNQPVRINPSIVQQRAQPPSYQAPRYQQPSYQAPRYQAPVNQAPRYQQPSYQAPRNSSPSYQAPRNNGGGGGGSRSAPSGGGSRGGGGGGGGHSSSGGGHSGGHR